MELRVDNTQFGQGNGGGGTFYQGRQGDGDGEEKKRDEKDEQPKKRVIRAKTARLTRDTCRLPPLRRDSQLTLSVMPKMPADAPAATDLEGLDEDIQRSLRLITLGMIKLEHAFERRMRAEVGDVIIDG